MQEGANNGYTRPDFKTIALITIDMQQDFLDGHPFEIPGTSAILPRMQMLTAAFRRAQLPIVHMVRLYKGDGSNVDLCRRSTVEQGAAIVRPGMDGAELANSLLPGPNVKLDADNLLLGKPQQLGAKEWAMYKPRWGAFFQTSLEQHLRGLDVTSIAFAGCNFPNCPRTSIYEASERDFRIVLVEDAISGLYDRGQDELRGIGVMLMSAEQLAQKIV